MPQRILITGGRGRIASLLAAHFASQGVAVEAYSRTPADGLRDYASLLRPGQPPATALLHLAWSTLPAPAELLGESAQAADLALLDRILDALAASPSGLRPRLFFFSSGGAVYGNAPGRPSREDDACHPISAYGRAKLAAEHLLAQRAARDGLPVAILRVSNPYGYTLPAGRQQGLIPHAIRGARSGQPLALWGDGSARKDFLHSEDFLRAISLAIARGIDGTFNLCRGESHTVAEVLSLIEQITGRRLALATAPAPAWDVHDSRLDGSKFAAATDWRPTMSLADGLRRSVAATIA